MVYEGLVSKYPEEVPVTLARSGWAGTQRFGASNWNGDLHAVSEGAGGSSLIRVHGLHGTAWCAPGQLLTSQSLGFDCSL